jgi:hypothetical protein
LQCFSLLIWLELTSPPTQMKQRSPSTQQETPMKKLFTSTLLLAVGLSTITPASAGNGTPSNPNSANASTLAVYGDAPYGCKSGECPGGYSPDTPNGPNPGDSRQIEATPAFIDAVNHDPKVDLVLHVGDIHSGSQYCTLSYNQTVSKLWKQFKDPLVYTPGDNEWTDCHKSGEGGNQMDSNGNYVNYANGDPVANLALIRSIFFPNPGETLGGRKKQVISQAQAYDPTHPKDAEYVENVMWEQSRVLFVTMNIPGGSNNDDDKWFGVDKTGTQIQEAAQRTAADLRWLEAAFATAQAHGDAAVVIAEQADMWDLDSKSATHIANYEPFIQKIVELTTNFRKPVLLFNGDSHLFRSDNPLMHGAPCSIESGASTVSCSDDAWDNHNPFLSPNVANFHRIVVHGSTFPLEYLSLKVDPRASNLSDSGFGPFSWERVIP